MRNSEEATKINSNSKYPNLSNQKDMHQIAPFHIRVTILSILWKFLVADKWAKQKVYHNVLLCYVSAQTTKQTNKPKIHVHIKGGTLFMTTSTLSTGAESDGLRNPCVPHGSSVHFYRFFPSFFVVFFLVFLYFSILSDNWWSNVYAPDMSHTAY